MKRITQLKILTMYSPTINTSNVEYLIFSLLPLPFCLLTLFILVYYIRRRYRLYQEINRIPQELLIMEPYRNHLKNLQLKCIINNFIIVILVLEFVQNMGEVIYYLPNWVLIFDTENRSMYPFFQNVQYYSYLFTNPIRFSVVQVVSLMMNFLWSAYRKYEYKYTIIRWTCYIVIRTSVLYLINLINLYHLLSVDYQNTFLVIISFLQGIFLIMDFTQFVFYSRKFYLHLKSREKEIRLFYFDNKAYLDIKYLRIHFKFATILVGIALFFYTIGGYIIPFQIITLISSIMPLPMHWENLINSIALSFGNFLFMPSILLFKLLITFNYLYIFVVVVFKSYRDRKKLVNINKYIKPIVNQYHENYYIRYCTNFA